ncbi:uncharacterized protein RMCC_2453 [Mycolicibacterium canariasense]|uniref:Uncharacterized protein n=1 Tax=Mycolicibacterium canariasense TaxID=228230 RepID=A0A100WBY7_MYCCR|nr:uncharacterized protein RMCC_2453 [Mycolicibacterium canariasense]
MSADAVRLVADVLRANFEPWLQGFMANYDPCNPPPAEWLAHCIEEWGKDTAAAVVAALGGLTQELSWRVGGVRGLVLDSTDAEDAEIIARRWVGQWKREGPAG